VVKKLVAKSHTEAYDLWATHFSDPALMANRDAATTRWKIQRVIEQLPLAASSRLLDVGPGDGALCAGVSDRIAAYCGVDPSPSAVGRLRELFASRANAEFELGSATALPFEPASFDLVVVNSVLHMFDSNDEAALALREAVRVCRPGGVVWIGELPFRSELGQGVLEHVRRKLFEFGFVPYVRLLWNVYVRPLLRGEPLLVYPARNLHVERAEFESWCAALGVAVECFPHREPARLSSTRNDYRLRVPT